MKKTHRLKRSVAATLAALSLLANGPAPAGGIPVIDGANFGQNIISATEEVAQTLKQVQEFQTQLQQYANQLQNTLQPQLYVWAQAQQTINQLLNATSTLNYYRQRYGSLQNLMAQFGNLSAYQNHPCFAPGACTPAQRAQIRQIGVLASDSQKRAIDAVLLGIDQQQQNLQNDAVSLQRIQSAAQSATGQMEAIGYANQLASAEINQLMHLRALLMAQHNAVAAKMQADADLAAQAEAVHRTMTRTNYQPSPAVNIMSLLPP